jgi:tol-pal system protein YbgF
MGTMPYAVRFVRGWFAIALLAASVGIAHAGLFEDEEARRAILDIRQRIDQLRQDSELKLSEYAKRASDDASHQQRALFDIQNQLETQRAEIAKLRGQNEQLARDVSELQQALKDSLRANEERLQRLEPSKVTVDGREFVATPEEKRDYEAALSVFRKGDFAAAQNVFVDFLGRYGVSGYRPSALFWLGNAQYANKAYKDAQANFKSLVSQAPDHMRAPEAMLAIANCQLEMKDARGARKTLEELISKYAGTEAAAAGKERLGRLK